MCDKGRKLLYIGSLLIYKEASCHTLRKNSIMFHDLWTNHSGLESELNLNLSWYSHHWSRPIQNTEQWRVGAADAEVTSFGFTKASKSRQTLSTKRLWISNDIFRPRNNIGNCPVQNPHRMEVIQHKRTQRQIQEKTGREEDSPAVAHI